MTQAKLEPGNTDISLLGKDPKAADRNRPLTGQEKTSSLKSGSKKANQPKKARVASPLDSGVNLGD